MLIGDTAQLRSVEIARAFEQLQQAGMKTFALDKIVRQTNSHTLAAVQALIEGDAAEASARLDAGAAIVEHADGASAAPSSCGICSSLIPTGPPAPSSSIPPAKAAPSSPSRCAQG